MEENTLDKRSGFEVSAACLKIVAVVLMIINHVGDIACSQWFGYYGFWYTFQWYISRASFVLFAFLISEGMYKTHDRKSYLFRLGLLALISEIPYDLCFYGTAYLPSYNNVFLTLFLGALGISLIDLFDKNTERWKQVVIALVMFYLAYLAGGDYDAFGVMVILAFYYLRDKKWLMFITVALLLFFGYFLSCIDYMIEDFYGYIASITENAIMELHGVLAFPLIALYKGKKGVNMPKWFFYGFYPAHLLLLWIITEVFFR